LPAFYLVRRIGIFFLIVWLAATLNFFLPRIGGENPVAQKVMQMAALGGNLHAGMQDMVKEYESKFGIDKPLWKQYLIYLADMSRFDFGYSISSYPRRVSDMILEGLPWTVCLITVTTILSFVIGNLLGAFQAWPRAPRWILMLMPPLLSMSAIPFFLLGLILVYVVGFTLQLTPMYGGYTAGSIPQWSFSFALDVVWHAILPATAIILGSLGGWALGMRAMMVTTQGEDYVTFAEAKGLSDRTLFVDYGIRNAMLPQVTALALSFGQLVSGAVLVEVVFGYPGIGTLLFQGIQGSDFFLVQGIVFLVIVAIGLATLILDLVYPLLDPRIVHRSA
jgi:peptide/nickel transport system permease protein